MRTKRIFLTLSAVILAFLTLTFAPCTVNAESMEVYLGGMPAGFVLDTKGADVIGTCDVCGELSKSPAVTAGIRAGDVILKMDGNEVSTAADIEKQLSSYNGNGITVTYLRSGEEKLTTVYPARDYQGDYKLGVFIRDNLTGIGTVTYVKKDGRFGALGHPVLSQEGQALLPVVSGNLYRCSISDVVKGERGKAGELRGLFLRDEVVGFADKNCPKGIFGSLSEKSLGACKEEFTRIETATIEDVVPGGASIYTTVDGTSPQKYEIQIIKADKNAAGNKNFVLQITDKRLLEKTAGILQGMSGSPIIQNGKLIGAVTHVFLNDPTRGFGIAIENMLNE